MSPPLHKAQNTTVGRDVHIAPPVEEVIAELMKMAKEMANAQAKDDALGLSNEEAAFYDALTRPEAVKDFIRMSSLWK